MYVSSLRHLVSQVRLFLEPLWIEAHEGWGDEPIPNPPSKYMCRYSCIFLQHVLKEAGQGEWEICLGRPASQELEGTEEGQFGYCSEDGKWYDHAWLEYKGNIIDITADQYGDSSVIVDKSTNKKYNSNILEKNAYKDIQKLKKRVDSWILLWSKYKKD